MHTPTHTLLASTHSCYGHALVAFAFQKVPPAAALLGPGARKRTRARDRRRLAYRVGAQDVEPSPVSSLEDPGYGSLGVDELREELHG